MRGGAQAGSAVTCALRGDRPADARGGARRRVKRYRRAKITQAERNLVARRQRWQCNGTCGDLLPARFQIDHVVPLQEGGCNEVANYQALCGTCHDAKTAHECIEAAKRRRREKAEPATPAPAPAPERPPPKRRRSWKQMLEVYVREVAKEQPEAPSLADEAGEVDHSAASVYFGQFRATPPRPPRTGGTGGRPGSSR